MTGDSITDKQIAHAKAFCEKVSLAPMPEKGIVKSVDLYRLLAWYRALAMEKLEKIKAK